MDRKTELRNHPRVDVSWPLTIFFENEKLDGVSRNISVEGLFIRCEKPLPLNRVFDISINPPDHQAMGLKGKIIWSDMYGIEGREKTDVFGLGICLVELSEEDKRQIKEMISNYL
jgi:hypothetical protein